MSVFGSVEDAREAALVKRSGAAVAFLHSAWAALKHCRRVD